MYTRAEIDDLVSSMLAETFEIPPEQITPQARLYEDLDLDSIDAIDMSVRLEVATDLKLRGEDMRTIRTVADISNALETKLAAKAVATP